MSKQEVPGFDLVVTHRDPLTGQVTNSNPYTMVVRGEDGGSKSRIFERPPGSGNLFNKKGEPIGRWDKDENGKKFCNEKLAHVEFKAPETSDQLLAKEVLSKDAKIEELQRELAAIKLESTKKDHGATKAPAKTHAAKAESDKA